LKRLILAGFLALGGCADDESDTCVFDGTYEIGFIPTNGCTGTSQRLPLYNAEDECSVQTDQIGLSGARQVSVLTCEPGDPVVECSGFMNDSDGCSFDVYMRRVSP